MEFIYNTHLLRFGLQEKRKKDNLVKLRSTSLFPNPFSFLGPSHGCILVTISPKTLIEKVDCQSKLDK
jgi:hypothetical protein